jgi:DNA-binding response OmpR family regulator
MRIVVVDDDPQIGRTIQLGWPDPSDTVEVYTSLEASREALFGRSATSVTCVVLDLKLPDASGSSILSEIRHTSSMPIIMLSGSGDSEFRTQMLLRGADDYVMKPVSVKELHARVLRLASRTMTASTEQQGPVDIGTVTFDPNARRLTSSAESQSLTEAESALLGALVYAKGKPVSREDLYVKGFGRNYREGEKALETYIGRLRQKLSALGEDGDARLLTARGIGYRLNL